MTESIDRERGRIMMISTHGYVAADPPLGAADTGGQVVYVLELSKKLASLGYSVDVWTRQFEDQPDEEIVADGVRIVRIPCGGDSFIPKEYLHEHLDEWAEGALQRIASEGLNYSFINSHYWDAGYAAELVSGKLEVPHVHTPHSLGLWKLREMERDFPESRDTFEEKYNFTERIRRETAIYSSCALVTATTPVQIGMLRDDYEVPEEKLRVIPPGYDDERFFPVGAATRSALRKDFGFEGKVVLALGRLAENKGYDLLIEAFALVAERVDDAILHLAIGGDVLDEGEQELLSGLRAQAAELGIGDRVTFDGFVPDEQLADIYRAADCFVLCSRYEPFGMTAIEAIASGTPAVVTTHGGLWQALSHGVDALFADPFDREDLGVTVTKLLQFEELHRRLSEAGARKVRSDYTWTNIAQQLITAIEERGSRSANSPSDELLRPFSNIS